MPSIRSGTSVRKFQNNRLLPQPTTSKGSNRPIFILDDENNTGGPQSTLINSKIALPIQSVIKAENTFKPTKWTEAHSVVNEVVAAVPAQPSFQVSYLLKISMHSLFFNVLFCCQVHVDDEIVLPSSQRKATDGFSVALKDKSVVTTKLNPQTLFERENPKVRLMCDLNKIMVGHREFSFEEIRRQCYDRSGRYPNKIAPTETPVTPISSAALLNVRSKEKSLKSRTPSDVSAITPKAKTPKAVAPPPPLKPNEKWHCDIEALYPGGQEWSFEQLRAQHYAARAAKKLDVPQPPLVVSEISSSEVPIVALPKPTVTLPSEPKKDAPTTREISVQTDLFGLDFDIQLVPRQKVSNPIPRTPSPPPAALEKGSPTNGSGSGSSPTVNTKQALSNVKSWFNESRLLPEPKAESNPSRKSLFNIFKDPSMVDVPDQRVPAQSAPFKPFTVFTEPEEEVAVPLQPKRFAIMDENAPPDQENGVLHAPAVPKARKPLSAIVPMPICQENPIQEEENVEDNFKENVPPASHVQEPVVKRQLSGILVPSVDIPCDPAGLVEEDMNTEEEEEQQQQRAVAQPSHANVSGVSRALFMGDEEEQTRHYCVPLNDEVDFTVPSAMAFANNLRIQSTPLFNSRHGQPLASLAAADEATFNLPRGRMLQVKTEPAPAVSVTAPPSSSRTLRGLSPIDERSREYFSSSGSSAGTTGLAHSRLSVGRSLHCADVARIYPPHFDPFDLEHRTCQLTQLAIPLHERKGFLTISGRMPWLRNNSSVQLGENLYIIKQQIGQGAYAKVYDASAEGHRLVLKIQESDGLWEYYITSELQRRLADSPTVNS